MRLSPTSYTHCLIMFQSTHPVRGATGWHVQLHRGNHVSIHAPREGCDLRFLSNEVNSFSVSIHAPREGCDLQGNCMRGVWAWFQSTHPVRGATGLRHLDRAVRDVSIHAPREGCDPYGRALPGHDQVSIHAPREGCDASFPCSRPRNSGFNPRTP